MQTLLSLDAIEKEFPGVKALNGVSFDIAEGEIIGLVGENGAGKSTLIKTVGGVHKAEKGDVYLDGKKMEFNSPNHALHSGISIVYQELSLCENMSIAENLCMNQLKNSNEQITLKVLNKKLQKQRAKELLELFELELNPDTRVGDLALAQREQIEILRAINYDPKLIILDEPTGPLSPPVVEKLFRILRELKNKGTSVLYISHEIPEVIELCDKVVILRDGEYITTLAKSEMEETTIANLMVGRELGMMFPEKTKEIGDDVVLSVEDYSHEDYFRNISFELKKGEILGMSGLIGAGRSELALTIFGFLHKKSGNLKINGKSVQINSPKKAMNNGIGYMTEDRKKMGLFLDSSVVENFLSIDVEMYSKNRVVQTGYLRKEASKYINKFDIKTSSQDTIVGTLSGGNQQKILLSKIVSKEPDILLIDEPTRGIDVGAKKAIHEYIQDMADAGKSIILISSEMTEVLGMSDRIMIMDNGKMVDIIENNDDINQEFIMNRIVQFKSKEKRNGQNHG